MREVEARLKLSAIDRTQKAFAAVASRLDQVEQKSKAVGRAQAAATRADRFHKQAAAIGRAESALAGYGKVFAGLAVASGIASAARASMDFEESLSEVGKKGGIAGDQLQAVGKQIKELSTSGELATTIDDITSSFERAAASGLPVEEWREFAKVTTQAADAFGMMPEAVGNSAAGFKVSLGIATKDTRRYFDLINSLADSGISNEADIIDFVDRSGASLKLFGMTNEQIAAMGSSMLNLKMPAEVASRAMNTLTSKLLAPGSKQAKSAFSAIVGDTKEFQHLLKTDANKALELFLSKIAKMDKFKSADLLTKFLGQGFSDEIIRAAGGLDEIKRNMTLAEGDSWFGSLDKSYAVKLDLAKSQLQLFKNQLAEVAIDVGTMGLPLMKSGLEAARDVVREIGDEIENFHAKVDMTEIEAAKKTVGELSEVISTLMGMGGDDTMVGHLFDRLAAAANATSGSINTIKDAMQAMGLIEDDGESPKVKTDRRAELLNSATELSPPIGVAADAYGGWRAAFGKTFLGEPGHGSEEAPPGIGRTTSDFVSSWPKFAPEHAAPQMPLPSQIDYSLPARHAAVISPREAEAASMRSMRDQFGGMLDQSGQAFPSGTSGQDLIDAADVDALRQAMEAGGQSLTTAGETASASLTQGTAEFASQVSQAATELRAAGSSIAADIRGALSAGVKVNMPGGPSSLPAANKASATTMPDAGKAGG